ncbi:MAG: hypothetical protein KC609_23110 [Myxococcales bacterium]|nr:hypothetical protein [Myxococcales bacterium]
MKKLVLLLTALALVAGCAKRRVITRTTNVYTGIGTDLVVRVITRPTNVYTGVGTDLVVKLRKNQASMLGEDFIDSMFLQQADRPVGASSGITQLINKQLSFLQSGQRDFVRLVIFVDKTVAWGKVMRVLLSANNAGIKQYQIGLYKNNESQDLIDFKSGDRLPLSWVTRKPSLELGDLVGLFSPDGTDLTQKSENEEVAPHSRLGTYPSPEQLVGTLEPWNKKSATKRLYLLFAPEMETNYVVHTVAALQNQAQSQVPSKALRPKLKRPVPKLPKPMMPTPKKSSGTLSVDPAVIWGLGAEPKDAEKKDDGKKGKKTAKKKGAKKPAKKTAKKKDAKKPAKKTAKKKSAKKPAKKTARKKRSGKKGTTKTVNKGKKKSAPKKTPTVVETPTKRHEQKSPEKPSTEPIGKKMGVAPMENRGDTAFEKPKVLKHTIRRIYVGLLRPRG